jgi:integrase
MTEIDSETATYRSKKKKAPRRYGAGAIRERAGRFQLRYSIGGKKFSKTSAATTRSEAEKELRSLLTAGDQGRHIAPSAVTVADWVTEWIELITRAPSDGQRRKGLVSPRTAQRYGELLRYVTAAHGDLPLQKLDGRMLDALYMKLENQLSTRTVLHLHNALRPCLTSAVKKRLISCNPCDAAETPSPENKNIAHILSEEELQALVKGFRNHPLEMVVLVAELTGMRRNEVLALRWADIDLEKTDEGKPAPTIDVTRSIEETKAFGRFVKAPKNARGIRNIIIDPYLARRLREYRDQIRRMIAGVPAEADVDLTMVKIPTETLLFPGGDLTDLTRLRDAPAVTRVFTRHAKRLGFTMRFHDLRASHLTLLLDKGEPVHVVAARAGRTAAVLLSSYAKWTKKSDAKVAQTLATFSKGMV